MSLIRYAAFSFVCFQDLFLERLYEQLDDNGLSENTYVVVVGDHGEVRKK